MAVRYRDYNPEETYFTIIDPKDIKDHNPLLLAIHSFIEEFDAGYFSRENLQYCHTEKLNAYVPEGRGESGVKQRESETIESRDCKLEIEGELKRLICPSGQVMEARDAKKRPRPLFLSILSKIRRMPGLEVLEKDVTRTSIVLKARTEWRTGPVS